MFNKNIDVFGTNKIKEKTLIEKLSESDVIFVSDMFAEDYVGGAELTTETFLLKDNLTYDIKKDYNICKIRSKELTVEILQSGIEKYWVFFNYSGVNQQLIPSIIANVNYSIVEYDYKFCKYRSTEKHEEIENKPCDCRDAISGKIVSAFMYAADRLFWMSEKQRDFYVSMYPFLSERISVILSSAFKKESIEKLRNVRENRIKPEKETALLLGSTSWIKGFNESKKYCEEKGIEYESVWNITHDEMIEKMSTHTDFVFLPKGKDTCPRIVIEAKLAGMNIHINDHVQHASEQWWSTNNILDIENYLLDHPVNEFWKNIDTVINRTPTLSGYTTTKDCISQNYPFEEAINSMLGFCDQVVVVDGGSKDGTWQRLEELAEKDHRILIEKRERDWNHKRFALFDGMQKAYARSLCTGEWCWQQDSDEIVHEKDYNKVKKLMKQIPKSVHLLALPVIEYWGSSEKVRIDVNPWKWRLSKNHNHITHGIPSRLRKYDENGDLYALQGTDGCDYIDNGTGDPIPCMNFYDENIHNIRIGALQGNQECLEWYENWFNNLVEQLPGVHHYSWMDLERKIKTYKNYWSKHWQSMYNIEQEDIPENNMFFNKKWSDVTDEEIKEMAEKLKEKMGGWIFHNKVNFSKPTPHIYIERDEPELMREK